MHLCIPLVIPCATEVADRVTYAVAVTMHQLLCLLARSKQTADRHEPAACMRVSCRRVKLFQAVSM